MLCYTWDSYISYQHKNVSYINSRSLFLNSQQYCFVFFYITLHTIPYCFHSSVNTTRLMELYTCFRCWHIDWFLCTKHVEHSTNWYTHFIVASHLLRRIWSLISVLIAAYVSLLLLFVLCIIVAFIYVLHYIWQSQYMFCSVTTHHGLSKCLFVSYRYCKALMETVSKYFDVKRGSISSKISFDHIVQQKSGSIIACWIDFWATQAPCFC